MEWITRMEHEFFFMTGHPKGSGSSGNWADEWCSYAYSKALNCSQKAGAFWWMMARLAGWNLSDVELVVDFGENGLWLYGGSSWSKMTDWDPEDDLTGWSGGVAIDFGDLGLWNYDGSTWTKIASWNPGVMTGMADGLAVDFDTHGLWKYDGSTWTRIATWDPENMDDVDLN